MNASPQKLFKSVSEYQNILLESKSKEEIDGITEKMRDLFNYLPFITIEGKSISGEEIAAFITKHLSLEMIISPDLSPETIWIKSPFYEIGQIPIAEARLKIDLTKSPLIKESFPILQNTIEREAPIKNESWFYIRCKNGYYAIPL